MPKVLLSLAAPAPTPAGAAADSSRAQRSRAGSGAKSSRGAGGFDEVLNGARRRDRAGGARETGTPSTPEADKAERAGGKKRSDATERAKRRQAPEPKQSRRAGAAADEEVATGDAELIERPEGASAPDAKAAEADHDSEGSVFDGKPETDDAADMEAVSAPQGDLAGAVAEQSAAGGILPMVIEDQPLVDAHPAAIREGAHDSQSPTHAPPNAHSAELTADVATLALAEAAPAAPDARPAKGPPVSEAGGESASSGLASILDAAGQTNAKAPSQPNQGGAAAPAAETGLKRPADAKRDVPAQSAASVPEGASSSNSANVVESLNFDSIAANAATAAPATGTAAPTNATDLSAQSAAAGLASDVTAKAAQPAPGTTVASAPALAPEVRFAEDNHANIIREMRGQLMPDGGTMRLRLDPPELGPLAVTVRLRNGVMEASFEASTEEAAKLLSHSLGTLKSSLETQGVNVERLNVQHAPKSEPANQNQDGGRDGQQGQGRDLQQEQSARQEQQRREMLRRMWRKLSGAGDPLDMVA